MTVDIKDLVISAEILEAREEGSEAGKPVEAGSDDGCGPPSDDLVAACVEQVLRILRREAMR